MVQERQPTSIRQAMGHLPEAFNAENAADARAIIQFHFTGNEAGTWTITIANGKCQVEEAKAEHPTVTVYTTSDVWLKIIRREMDPATAFMSGLFTFIGDIGTLVRMREWFPQGD
ncbi:MAG TPA: SCP2 sterol-binding domain-containing protein [Dehalococcoidia bacterium]|nr:SCP2 sterol-binding domain-containing protein [Dehalococcoidia bacterium]